MKKQLWPDRELRSKKTLPLPKTEYGFHYFIHSKKNLLSGFFCQMPFSLPKLAVKNNSSKKSTQMWAKHAPKKTVIIYFLTQGRWAPSDPIPMLPVCRSHLTTRSRLPTRPLNVSHVSRIIKQKTINSGWTAAESWAISQALRPYYDAFIVPTVESTTRVEVTRILKIISTIVHQLSNICQE